MEYGSEEWREQRIRNGIMSGDLMCDSQGRVVCSTCAGNCGQCGLTDVVGNIPANMTNIVRSVYNQPAPQPATWSRFKAYLRHWSNQMKKAGL